MIRVSMQGPAHRDLGEGSFELVAEPLEAEVLVVQVEADDDLPPRRWLSEQMPPLIVLHGSAPVEWLRAGVRGLLPPDAEGPELAAAIRAVHAGLSVIHPDLLAEASGMQPAVAVAPTVAPSILTPRELEVLRRVAEGLPNKIIAHEMSISEHTVKFHIAQILNKLQAGSRTEAVTAGLRMGIVHL